MVHRGQQLEIRSAFTATESVVFPVCANRACMSTNRFRVSIPENWSEVAPNPVTLGPAGAFRLNNGRPELTHGLMMGIAAARDW